MMRTTEVVVTEVMVTDYGTIEPKKWGKRMFREAKFTKNGWPDRRYKKGRLVDRYMRRLILLQEKYWLDQS